MNIQSFSSLSHSVPQYGISRVKQFSGSPAFSGEMAYNWGDKDLFLSSDEDSEDKDAALDEKTKQAPESTSHRHLSFAVTRGLFFFYAALNAGLLGLGLTAKYLK